MRSFGRKFILSLLFLGNKFAEVIFAYRGQETSFGPSGKSDVLKMFVSPIIWRRPMCGPSPDGP